MSYKSIRNVVYAIPLVVALNAAPAYAERVDGFGDYIGNLASAIISAPFKLFHRPGREALKSADSLGRKVPVLGHAVGAGIGVFRGVTYGALDAGEGLGEGVTGFAINDPMELGDGSATLDSCVGGRVVAAGLAGGAVGGLAEIAGGVGEGMVAGSLTAAAAQGVDEYCRKDHPDKNDPRAARLIGRR